MTFMEFLENLNVVHASDSANQHYAALSKAFASRRVETSPIISGPIKQIRRLSMGSATASVSATGSKWSEIKNAVEGQIRTFPSFEQSVGKEFINSADPVVMVDKGKINLQWFVPHKEFGATG